MPDQSPVLKRELRLWDLVFLNVAAVASVRWVAAAAHSGPGSISLWILAILAFFIPSALVVASLSRRFPEEGGLYIWTKRAFGDWHGFLCAWLYFISNLLFVPSLALAAVAMSGYIWSADPSRLAQDRTYTLTVTLILLWGAFLSHLFGLKIGKWAGNAGGVATYASAAVLALAAGWLLWRVVALAVLQFFADEVVQAIEARDYPAMAARARKLGWREELARGLGGAGRALAFNLIALPFALLLLITGVGAPLVFIAVNAVLLGRELQDMVWLRHRPSPTSPAPLSAIERLALGGVTSLLLTVPIANFAAPFLGAACAVHLIHRKGLRHDP